MPDKSSLTIEMPNPANQTQLTQNLAALARTCNSLGLEGKRVVELGIGRKFTGNRMDVVVSYLEAERVPG